MSLNSNPLFLAITETGVLDNTPESMRKAGFATPGNVRAETIDTNMYDRLKSRVVNELTARIAGAGADPSLLNHPILVSAAEAFIAARILRVTRSYAELGDSLFAEANILLRQFFEDVALVAESGSGAEIIVIDETEFGGSESNNPWLPNPNYAVSGWFEVEPPNPDNKPKPFKPR